MVRVEPRIVKPPWKLRECCTPYFKLTVLTSMTPLPSLSMTKVRSLNWASLICMRPGVPYEWRDNFRPVAIPEECMRMALAPVVVVKENCGLVE